MGKSYYMGSGGTARGADPDDTRTTVEGVAKTGQVSKQGTVEHTEHRDGRVDAQVFPAPLSIEMRQG